MVTVTAVAYQGSSDEALQVLKGDDEAIHGQCPLDIKVDLMVGEHPAAHSINTWCVKMTD